MIKYIYLLIALLSVVSCNNVRTGKDNETIRVSILKGPSAIVFAQWLDNPPVINGKTISITFAESPDIIQASMIKKETDLAVLPMISAANLYNKGVDYSLLGCPLWGTLYLIGRNSNPSKKEVHLFGAGTTPDILTRYYLDCNNLNYSLNYSFNTASEVLQSMITGKSELAVLSEPFVSVALKKDTTLHILADLNNPGNSSSPGFPQTAIVYNASCKNEILQLDSLLQASCQYANENPEEVIRILEKHQVFVSGMITAESINRCKIHYLTAKKAQQSIYSFFDLIKRYEPRALGGKLPDSEFILKP